MARLKLPRAARSPAGVPPQQAAAAADSTAGFTLLLSRRDFLRAGAVLAALFAAPLTGFRRAAARARGGFFTRRERATLSALVDRILPPDRDPGARALGAVAYIETLLTAFDGPGTPRIFAGGPFSDRNPLPDPDTGRPSRRRPPNAFAEFVPLTRLQALRWRAELFGSAAAGLTFNDALAGPLRGLRDVYREGLARVDETARTVAGAPFARLSVSARDRILDVLDVPGALPVEPGRDRTFLEIATAHTLEGCFAAPEYGGNRRRRGWRMIGLEGDSQPLGYSIFSRPLDGYVGRRTHPMSTPDPGDLRRGHLRPRRLSADARSIQDAIASLTRGAEDCLPCLPEP
jgi:hypothetical protein